MTSIYALSGQLAELQSLMDSEEEGMAEAIQDTILGMSGEIGDVAEDAGKLIRNIELQCAGIDAEIDRLTVRKKSLAKQVENTREAIKGLMERAEYTSLKTTLFTFTLAKGRESVQVINQDLIPDDYVTVKTVIQPDKKAIADAFKAGQSIEGCEYVRGEPSLRIK